MSSRNPQAHINAQIEIVGGPRCSGPHCHRSLGDVSQTVFVIKGGAAMGFCSTECYTQASQLYLDQSRANKVTKRKNLLRGMGYRFGDAETEESAPSS